MKKLVLLMTVAAIGTEAYAADRYPTRNYRGERNGYAAREPEEQDFRAERRSPQDQQRLVMAELGQNPRFKAARDAEVQESRYATREEEQDPRYAAPARRSPAELERERALQEEELRQEDEMRARTNAQRRRIEDRERQAEEEQENQRRSKYNQQQRYRNDADAYAYDKRADQRRVVDVIDEGPAKPEVPVEKKASTIDQVKKFATADNINAAKETLGMLKGLFG